jgi:hypothetical protein
VRVTAVFGKDNHQNSSEQISLDTMLKVKRKLAH